MSTKKLQIITPIVTSVNGETGDITMHSVEYTPQTLTDEQKAQARENIGAVDSANGLLPVECILPFGMNNVKKTIFVKNGVMLPLDYSTATGDIKKAIFGFSMLINSIKTSPTTIDTYVKHFAILVENGIFGDDFYSSYTYPSNVLCLYDSPFSPKIEIRLYSYYVASDSRKAFVLSVAYASGNKFTRGYNPITAEFINNYIDYVSSPIAAEASESGDTPSIQQVEMSSAPTTDMQIATKKYVDDNKTTVPTNVSAFTNDANYATTTEVNKKLSLSGGTMTGDIDMGQNSLNNVGEIRMPKGEGGAYITPAGTPTAPSLEIMGLNGDEPVEITGVANPTSNGSAANKSYVDTGLEGKANSSHNHSASNITSGTLPITRGGTNASTAAAARINLGFSYGTSVPTSAPATGNGAVFFCQDSGSPLSIANGGTGGATQDAARTNLGLPTQDGRVVIICNGTRLVTGSNITITLDPTEAKKYSAILILLGTPLGGNYGNMYDSFVFPLNPDTWSFRFFKYTLEGQDWQCAKANLSSDWTTFTITAVSGDTNHPCWCYLM